MANEVTKWDEKLAEYAQKQAAVERPSVAKITFRSGHMSYQGSPIAGNTMPVVILASVQERALYENVITGRAFDPNKPENPICFMLNDRSESDDGSAQLDLGPHHNSRSPKSDTCATCAYNAWGSDPQSASRGARAKACKDRRKLYLLPSTAIIVQTNNGPVAQDPDKTAKIEAATCDLPVTSVRNWAKYLSMLSSTCRRPSWAVLTKMSVVPHAKTQFEVVFEHLLNIPEQYLGALHSRLPEAARVLMTPYDPASPATASATR